MIAVHHLASGITQFASIARKQKLPTVSLEALSRYNTFSYTCTILSYCTYNVMYRN